MTDMRKHVVCLLILSLFTGMSGACHGEEAQQVWESLPPVSAWAAYWDDAAVVLDEAAYLLENEALAAIIFFAVHFDVDDALSIPDSLPPLIVADLQAQGKEPPVRYLSFVNDFELHDGTYSQKDVPLLHRLLGDPQARTAHIEDILRLFAQTGCDGIEIDYEGMGDDLALWDDFLMFIEALQAELEAENVPLRVLLEPGAPLDAVTFPVGMEYVMMCYNLYGNHSGPGPKADLDFLQDITERMAYVPQPHNYALAAGGYDWTSQTVTQLTWQTAAALQSEYGAPVTRDPQSQALSFAYWDAEGVDHTVWYADMQTIVSWIEAIRAVDDAAFSLWRLGGNDLGRK